MEESRVEQCTRLVHEFAGQMYSSSVEVSAVDEAAAFTSWMSLSKFPKKHVLDVVIGCMMFVVNYLEPWSKITFARFSNESYNPVYEYFKCNIFLEVGEKHWDEYKNLSKPKRGATGDCRIL